MSTLTVRLPEALKREIRRCSRQRGVSTGDLVRESLQRYLAAEGLRALRASVVPRAEAQGFLTDEDVFRVVS